MSFAPRGNRLEGTAQLQMSFDLDDIIDEELSGAKQARRPRLRYVLALVAVIAPAVVLGRGLPEQAAGAEAATEIDLHATNAVPAAASATIRLGRADVSGNRALTLVVAHLPPSRGRIYYELDLTRSGRPAVSCGRFELQSARATVSLNLPYPLHRFDGWAVVRDHEGEEESEPFVVLRSR
jgi:hypothetical protein